MSESYQVIARKYRPQQFGEVVGQEHITRTLQNALSLQRVAHAYLFVGPRGTGKTTLARIFSKALNCRAGTPGHPCDQCESCVQIREGRSLDVIEIDGASNNGVEEVRNLRDSARYLPAHAPYKIYIIDEVHMLTVAAFNALLKTLEEPPAHVKFLFATTDPQKLPATIISRCQRFDLRRISARDIAAHLRFICGKEQVEITDDALAAIARGAEGGLRDAQSALDQLIAFRGKSITEADVLSVFGLISRERLESLARALIGGDVPGILRLLDEMEHQGTDLKRVLVELLEWFRHLLAWIHVRSEEALDLPESLLAGIRESANTTDAGRALRIIEALLRTDGEMRYAMAPRLMMDIGLMRAARAATAVSLDQLIRELNALRQGIEPPEPPPASTPPPAARRAPAAPEPALPASPPPAAAGDGPPDARSWSAIAARISSAYPHLARLLKGSRLETRDDGSAILWAPATRDEDLAPLQELKVTAGIEKMIHRNLHLHARLSVRRAEPDAKSAPAAPVEEVEPPPPERPPDAAPSRPRRNVRKQAQEHPTVKNLLNVFGGVIEDIKE